MEQRENRQVPRGLLWTGDGKLLMLDDGGRLIVRTERKYNLNWAQL